MERDDDNNTMDHLQIRKVMLNLLIEYNRLKAIHDKHYAEFVVDVGDDEALVTIDQMALIFGLSQDRICSVVNTASMGADFRDNYEGLPSLRYGTAKSLMQTDPGLQPASPEAVAIVRALRDMPGVTDMRIAAAAGISAASLALVKFELDAQSALIVAMMTQDTEHTPPFPKTLSDCGCSKAVGR